MIGRADACPDSETILEFRPSAKICNLTSEIILGSRLIRIISGLVSFAAGSYPKSLRRASSVGAYDRSKLQSGPR